MPYVVTVFAVSINCAESACGSVTASLFDTSIPTLRSPFRIASIDAPGTQFKNTSIAT